MIHQNIPTKKSFKLDDLSRELGVKKFIIKNWEKEFDCKKSSSDGKYSQEDYKTFVTIKDLLLNKKLSYSAAKKELQNILAGKEPIKAKEESQVIAPTQDIKVETMPQNLEAAAETAQTEAPSTENKDFTQETESFEQDINTLINEIICKPIMQGEHKIEVSESNLQEEASFKAAQETEISQNEPQVSQDEMLAAISIEEPKTEEITKIKPAFKEKEEFFKSIQSFKEQLLKIQEQLK